MKVKLFTHTDLDGVGCAVVANVAFGEKNVSVEYCDYSEINTKVSYFIAGKGHEKYDRIFITDISITEDVADLIDKNSVLREKFQLIDHHATALPLSEKYEWCKVSVKEESLFPRLELGLRDEVLASGTSLFFKFLLDKNMFKGNYSALIWLVESIRRYDCWEWSTVYKNDHPKKLNDLLYIVGREKFVTRFSENPFPAFNETEKTLLEIEEHRINKYIWYKKQQAKVIGWHVGGKEYQVAYVFAEQNVSLLGNAIAEQYGGLVDFVAIIDVGNSKVSLRSIHEFPHLGTDISKHYGGGGHSKASGFEISDGLGTLLMLEIINKGKGIDA